MCGLIIINNQVCNSRVLRSSYPRKMAESERLDTEKESPPVLPYEPKSTKPSTATSSILGALSIAFTLLAFLTIIAFNRWMSLAVFLAAPLMAISLTTSIIGFCLTTGTVIGKRVSKIGCILALSPVLVAGWPALKASLEDRKHYHYVDGVQFNKEKTLLTKYPQGGPPYYTIPDGVTGIADNAFLYCDNLMSITISDGVTTIGNGAFYGCTNLTSITIPDSVTSIGKNAFSSCSYLKSIMIPDGITSIERGTFSSCTGLTSVTIPNGVASIGNDAFSLCTSLMRITIGNSVTRIGGGAFYGSSGLNRVTFLGNAPEGGEEIFDPFGKSSPIIYRKPEAKGWGDTWGGRPVKLINDKP